MKVSPQILDIREAVWIQLRISEKVHYVTYRFASLLEFYTKAQS